MEEEITYNELHQGQIIWVSFNPTRGHEQKKSRPAIILSNDDFNQLCGGMVKVAPITSNEKRYPLHIKLPALENVHGVVEIEQERTLDLSDRSFRLLDEVPQDFLTDVLKVNNATY